MVSSSRYTGCLSLLVTVSGLATKLECHSWPVALQGLSYFLSLNICFLLLLFGA